MVFALNNEILLPENAPVRLTSAQLEELDYRKLYRAYSVKGRKSKVDPRVLFKVMAYGYQCGIYSSRKLEEACRYRVDFMWLLEEESVPDHTTLARFRTGRCAEAVENLFYQYHAHRRKATGDPSANGHGSAVSPIRIFHDAPAVSVLSGHGTRSGNDRSSARAHHEPLHVKTISSRLHARRSTTYDGG